MGNIRITETNEKVYIVHYVDDDTKIILEEFEKQYLAVVKCRNPKCDYGYVYGEEYYIPVSKTEKEWSEETPCPLCKQKGVLYFYCSYEIQYGTEQYQREIEHKLCRNYAGFYDLTKI
jgi:hypothetical protein